ncbi:hypothetical protein Vadar_024242 [Vaccinium darrowii]|uniref:Uncharacterized protein n=1 Tax=Vaccinium darrowii TaxID=229202 RepID=A0ACB7YFP5_9ERIC|nr:hypothetical protein Vadar_024242 [Vaccinium darrowii]
MKTTFRLATLATFVTDRSHGAAVTRDDGNPLYMAPKLKVEDAQVSDKVDIFSLGLVFCDLLYQFITDSERAKMFEILRRGDELPDGWDAPRPIVAELTVRPPASQLQQRQLPWKDDELVGTCTGFVISQDGLAATTAHTFGEMKDGKLQIWDVEVCSIGGIKSENIQVSPIGLNTGTDLAIFQLLEDSVKKHVKHIFKLGNYPEAGDSLYMIKHPLAGPFSARFSEVSKSHRLFTHSSVPNPLNKPLFFQYLESCLVSDPGASGAPCINSSGEVVAVHQSSRNYRRSGFWSCGVPTKFLKDLINWVKSNKSSTDC